MVWLGGRWSYVKRRIWWICWAKRIWGNDWEKEKTLAKFISISKIYGSWEMGNELIVTRRSCFDNKFSLRYNWRRRWQSTFSSSWTETSIFRWKIWIFKTEKYDSNSQRSNFRNCKACKVRILNIEKTLIGKWLKLNERKILGACRE